MIYLSLDIYNVLSNMLIVDKIILDNISYLNAKIVAIDPLLLYIFFKS